MKISAHPNRHHVSAEEVRLVLDHAQSLTQQQWAEFFGVSLATVQAWRTRGFFIRLWSAPTAEKWNGLKADAIQNLRGSLRLLTSSSRQ